MIDVHEAEERNRFEVSVDGEVVGFAVYHVEGGQVAFPHTEVDPEHQHRGLASELIRVALETARGRDQQVLPYCPFVSAYIAQHPEFLDLVPDRAMFGLAATPARDG